MFCSPTWRPPSGGRAPREPSTRSRKLPEAAVNPRETCLRIVGRSRRFQRVGRVNSRGRIRPAGRRVLAINSIGISIRRLLKNPPEAANCLQISNVYTRAIFMGRTTSAERAKKVN
uniref:Uncharacterized protein n=1 Tax=Trichuris muris TaxID=70415 RepID=A0A5S6Q7S3_TRIMR